MVIDLISSNASEIQNWEEGHRANWATEPWLLPNDDVQRVMEEHQARSRADHFPAGFLPTSYRLIAEDMSTFPNIPQGLVDAQGRSLAEAGRNFREHEGLFFILRINCTFVHFA